MPDGTLGPYELDRIYTGECSELMAELPAGCIDLTVTSPPYDNLRDYNGYEFPFEEIAAQLYRVTKPGGVVVWVVADATIDGSETGTSFRQALHFMALGFNLHQTIIYEKDGLPFPPTNRYYNQFEYSFVFARGNVATFNPLMQKNRWAGASTRPTFRQVDGGQNGGDRKRIKDKRPRGNIWRYTVGHSKSTLDRFAFEHPATFPEALARDHIRSWSDPGDIVLDPMCGSGTTLKMAHETGRRFIGFDISEEYCELARRRVRGARTPLPLGGGA